MSGENDKIAAVVLAAGQSKRMGKPKLLLPWGDKTVIQQIITETHAAGVLEIFVVTGGFREQIEENLNGYLVKFVNNPDYLVGDMLESLHVGLRAIPNGIDACLVMLGDQPKIQHEIVQRIIEVYKDFNRPIIIPSYKMKRGHPWLVDRSLWATILKYKHPKSLRNFLTDFSSSIHYVDVDTDSVLSDLDTPEDYEKDRPKYE